MAQRTNADNIQIEPCFASWEQQQVLRVKVVADEAGSLGGSSFALASPGGEFYAFTGTDPATAGKTGIEYTAPADGSASAVATALVTGINASEDFHAKKDPNDSTAVLIQAKASGEVLSAAADVDAGFTITTVREGAELQLGSISGDITLGLTENISDVTSHQTGTQVIQALRTGRNISDITVSLQESDASKLKAFIEASGVEYTPEGVGATAVSAWGSEDVKSVGNISSDSRKLVFHPARKEEGDLSADWCFWRAYPKLDGFVISGENPRLINVSFKIIVDSMLAKEARQFVLGDHTQNFLG